MTECQQFANCGTNARYVAGCHVGACKLAHKIQISKYRSRRAKRGGRITMYGIDGGHLRVPAEKSRKHLDQLRKKLSMKRIAELLGMNYETLRNVYRCKTISHVTERKIVDMWNDYCAPLK